MMNDAVLDHSLDNEDVACELTQPPQDQIPAATVSLPVVTHPQPLVVIAPRAPAQIPLLVRPPAAPAPQPMAHPRPHIIAPRAPAPRPLMGHPPALPAPQPLLNLVFFQDLVEARGNLVQERRLAYNQRRRNSKEEGEEAENQK